MTLVCWDSIKAKSTLLFQLANDSQWEQVVALGKELEQELECFFTEVAPSLSYDEQMDVKHEGMKVVDQITAIIAQSKLEKSKLAQQAGKVVKSKKGISAYKSL